jgi:NADH-quinone oxidoreductase subunit N
MPVPVSDLMLAAPQWFVLIMTCVTLLVSLWSGKKASPWTYGLSQVTLLGAVVITALMYDQPRTVAFYGNMIFDKISALLTIFVCVITAFVLLYSRDYLKQHKMAYTEYHVLTLFSALGMMVLVSSYSFISLYVGLELFTLPLYALIALRRDAAVFAEASMKYFVMGAMASGMLLYGLSMLYGATGTVDIPSIASAIVGLPQGQHLIIVFGLVFVLAGIAFKLGAVPFHMWVPDVYDGSPNTVTLMIATGPKIAAFGLVVRLLAEALPDVHVAWQHGLILIAVLSIVLGNIVAIVQTNIKRMLAYSSIAHMGYMLLGIIAGTASGYSASMFYTLIYAIMSLAAFGLVSMLSRDGVDIQRIEDLRGLNARNPWLAFMMLLVMFSMAGVPPLAGFMAKIAVLEAVISVGQVWLAVVALLFAIVGAYYYLRVVKVMYFDEPIKKTDIELPSMDMRVAMTINGLSVLILGMFPAVLMGLCRAAF